MIKLILFKYLKKCNSILNNRTNFSNVKILYDIIIRNYTFSYKGIIGRIEKELDNIMDNL